MTFTPEIYEQGRAGAIRSAKALVPVLLDIADDPKTVVDVGCGEGWFAREFALAGAYVVGVDSEGPYAPPPDRPDRYTAMVKYPDSTGQVDFYRRDLTRGFADLCEEPFGLAVCLEVAEHLPESAADALVAGLCTAAPVVAFSAAIPGQTGHGHVNCQWPAYWASRFNDRGYLVSGGLRYKIWDDERIEPWYRQNLLLAAHMNSPVCDHGYFTGAGRHDGTYLPLPLVHPSIWAWKL